MNEKTNMIRHKSNNTQTKLSAIFHFTIKGMAMLAIFVPCLFLTGCAAHEMIIAKGSKFETSTRATCMILPFGDANSPQYRLKYQNAASVVRDALETAFIEQGFKIIRCPEAFSSEAVQGVAQTVSVDLSTEQLNAEVTKQHFEAKAQATLGKQSLTEGQAIEIGKRGGADLVLFGLVTAYYRGLYKGFGDYDHTTVGFSVKAIDTKTGEIAWKVTLIRKCRWDTAYEPSVYAVEIARQLATELMGKK